MENLNPLQKTIWTITILFVLLTIGAYVYNFRNQAISNNTENWAHLGDYIGGILNTFISLLNLVVLFYITKTISKIEDKRNEWTLQELARPLGQIVCGDYENKTLIKFKNCGLGPLVITKITVSRNGEIISENLIDILPPLPKDYYYSDFIRGIKNYVIAKDSEINLLKFEGDLSDSIFANTRNLIRRTLMDLKIEISYIDIYNRQMPSATRTLELFGTRLP